MARTASEFDLTPQRGENDEINWGSVASGFNKTITDAINRRKARKKAIADSYAAQAEKLSQIEESDDPTVQAQLVQASQASMRELSDRYDLVKSGLLSPEDFALFQTNQKADYKTASMYMKGMGKWAANVEEKIKNNTATNQDIFLYDFLTKYGGLAGVELTTGKDGRLVYNTKKNMMTMEMAKKALAKQRGLAGNPGGGISEISDEDAKKYMQANPVYGDEFNQDRGATIGVQDLYKLFNYRGDPGVVVDTTGAINEQVKILGDYVRTYFDADTAQTITTNDFRNAPGTTDTKKGGAYRETLKILQDKLATSDGEIVQVLTNLGGYQLALSEQDAKQKYGEDVDLDKILFVEYNNGQVTYTNLDGKKEVADGIIERELNKQLDSSVTKTAPNAAYLNYLKTSGADADKLTAYVNAVEKMLITSDKDEFDAQARLLVQRVNQGGTLGDIKLNRIIRQDNSYILEFEDANGQIFRERPIPIEAGQSTKDIHEALFSLITPGDISFEIYKGALDEFGVVDISVQDYQRAMPEVVKVQLDSPVMPGANNTMVSTIEYLKTTKGYGADVRSDDMEGLPGTIQEVLSNLLFQTGLENEISVSFQDADDPDGVTVIIGDKDYSDQFNWTSSDGMEEGFGGINVKKLNAAIHKVYNLALKDRVTKSKANNAGKDKGTASGELNEV